MIFKASSRTIFSLLLATGAFGCAVDATETDADDPAGEAASPVILGGSDWKRMPLFRGDPNLDTGTFYGRATAQGQHFNPNGGGTPCSGFLVDDDVYVTAKHCRLDSGSPTTVTATFGQYDPDDGSTALGIAEAMARLRAIGVPQTTINSLPQSTWTRWTCNLIPGAAESNRDIDYYRCPVNAINWVEGSGNQQRWVNFGLKPGHVFGHYNVAPAPGVGAPLYATSFNRTCGASTRSILTSPGALEDTSVSCTGSGNEHCLSVTADWVGGSSGGAVVNRATNTVFGVAQGQRTWWFGNPDDVCEHWSAAENIATYLGPSIYTLLQQDPGGGAPPLGSFASVPYTTIGGTGGGAHFFTCPEGQLAAGVVGTTGTNNAAGNLGLVCVPHRNAAFSHRLDRATVLAGGSQDTGFHVANREDFNTYINEVQSTSPSSPGTQQLVMCPPGYFVTKLTGRSGTYVSSVINIRCETPDPPSYLPLPQSAIKRDIAFSGNAIGTSTAGAVTDTACPAGAYFAGMLTRTGWVTDAFTPICRYPD